MAKNDKKNKPITYEDAYFTYALKLPPAQLKAMINQYKKEIQQAKDAGMKASLIIQLNILQAALASKSKKRKRKPISKRNLQLRFLLGIISIPFLYFCLNGTVTFYPWVVGSIAGLFIISALDSMIDLIGSEISYVFIISCGFLTYSLAFKTNVHPYIQIGLIAIITLYLLILIVKVF